MIRRLIPLAALVLVSCGTATDRVETDTAETEFERGVNAVGRRLETAAAGLHSKVEETRIQAVIDNIRGFEHVEVQMLGEGHVRLIGVVADEPMRRDAERIASRIVGVSRVESALVVGK